MIDDSERREVARRLRGISRDVKFWGGVDPLHYVKKGVFGDVDRHGPNETIDRLADLIEPSCDRDALLALADEMEEFGNLPVKHPGIRVLQNDDFSRELGYARRIREALGASE